MGEWIPLAEREPPYEGFGWSDPVEVRTAEGRADVARLDGDSKIWYSAEWEYDEGEVTHWRPLEGGDDA